MSKSSPDYSKAGDIGVKDYQIQFIKQFYGHDELRHGTIQITSQGYRAVKLTFFSPSGCKELYSCTMLKDVVAFMNRTHGKSYTVLEVKAVLPKSIKQWDQITR